MRRLNLTIIIFILICLISYTRANAQIIAVTCNRSTIESYAGSEKEPVLRHLDEARQVADEFMRLFVEDRFDEIKGLKSLTIYVKKESVNETVGISLPAFRQEYGQIASYQYRDQHLYYNFNRPIQLRGAVATWYEIIRKNSAGERHFISVETNKFRAGEKFYISSLTHQKSSKDRTPWQYAEDKKPKGCVNMEDKLKVKID